MNGIILGQLLEQPKQSSDAQSPTDVDLQTFDLLTVTSTPLIFFTLKEMAAR